jgi:methionyl-tRNA formyltransferase
MINILATNKTWHDKLFVNLKTDNKNWLRVTNTKELLGLANNKKYRIFFPHWSKIIPKSIYTNHECIVFHMTDLPYGRGGSPLQNLIVNGFKKTKISAIKVKREIDSGPIYLKRTLSLNGTAFQIFCRSSKIIERMIKLIINNDIKPTKQIGEVTYFKRRTSSQSNINQLCNIDKIYDYIRMLDCEGYPDAFIETEYFIVKFRKAKKISNNELKSYVSIKLKNT